MNSTITKGRWTGFAAALVSASLALTLSACGTSAVSGSSEATGASSGSASAAAAIEPASSGASESASSASNEIAGAASSSAASAKDSAVENETIENSADGEHAIEADGTTASYTNVTVNKTGDADGDEADFYGENAAVFATNKATLDLSEITVKSNGTHANGVFSYGEGTTVNISDSVIETSSDCSGGLMTTGGGTMNAKNLTITTQGRSSAAIRSDRGGGTVNVDGGTYTTSGMGSPAIYSTADITVSNAELTSTASQGVVVEGKNSVTLNDVKLVADNNTKNSDKSDYYQAVMIYQSMSGDAAEGEASFTMNGGSLTNKNGDVFFVNNTVATISLANADIVNESDGVFLRAAAAGWGTEGSNGGQVTLNAKGQAIDGDMVVDDVSHLNLILTEGSSFEGAINSDGSAGKVYVELAGGSTWTLMGDSNITSLTCESDSINLNGHTLYVNGKAYEEGTASSGDAIEVTVSESTGGTPGNGDAPSDMPSGENGSAGAPPSGEKPSGEPPALPDGEKPSGEPPARPDGENFSGEKPSGEPPARPDGEKFSGERPSGEFHKKHDGESSDSGSSAQSGGSSSSSTSDSSSSASSSSGDSN